MYFIIIAHDGDRLKESVITLGKNQVFFDIHQTF